MHTTLSMSLAMVLFVPSLGCEDGDPWSPWMAAPSGPQPARTGEAAAPDVGTLGSVPSAPPAPPSIGANDGATGSVEGIAPTLAGVTEGAVGPERGGAGGAAPDAPPAPGGGRNVAGSGAGGPSGAGADSAAPVAGGAAIAAPRLDAGAAADSVDAGMGQSGGERVGPCPSSAELWAAANDEASDLSPLSSDFDHPDSAACFARGGSNLFDVHVDTEAGQLVLEPRRDVGLNGWIDAYRGAFLYYEVAGNFKVDVRLRVVRATDHSLPPEGPLTTGGLLLELLDVPDDGPSWFGYTAGYQRSWWGRGVLNTRGASSETFFNRIAGKSAFDTPIDLRICVVGVDVLVSIVPPPKRGPRSAT